MDVLQLIERKRAGGCLTDAEINELVRGVTEGSVPGYQLAALLMVICYEHLTYAETRALTAAFVASGEVLDWPETAQPVVDKHSTGGVGDKVSLVLVPWLAAVGLRVPKMSGRGLGHTGGTIDKLESIPGFRTDLCPADLRDLLDAVGCAVASQGANLVPADKKFYAMRDATGTVDEVGLIAASVLGKKLAAGAPHIVLDVKCGSGAFFTRLEEAREFAALVIRLGGDLGRDVACVISGMDQPLGQAIGNALEVREAIAFVEQDLVLADLQDLCCVLGGVLLNLSRRCRSLDEGRSMMLDALGSGAVAEKFHRWIAAQGGDLGRFRQSLARLDTYRKAEVLAPLTGYLSAVDANRVGHLARKLGAGRMVAGGSIDPLVGIEFFAKVGDAVDRGTPVAVVWASPSDTRGDKELAESLQAALTFTDKAPMTPETVLDVVWPSGLSSVC